MISCKLNWLSCRRANNDWILQFQFGFVRVLIKNEQLKFKKSECIMVALNSIFVCFVILSALFILCFALLVSFHRYHIQCSSRRFYVVLLSIVTFLGVRCESLALLHFWPVNPVSWRPFFKTFIVDVCTRRASLSLFPGNFFLLSNILLVELYFYA